MVKEHHLEEEKGSKAGELTKSHRSVELSEHQYLESPWPQHCAQTSRGADPSPNTASLLCPCRAGKARADSASPAVLMPHLYFQTSLLPALPQHSHQASFSWRYSDMQSACKDRNYGKQLICTGHSNLTAMLEQPGCSTLPLHYSSPICCSIRSSWRKGKWDSVHESTNESDFSFTYESILKRRKLH